MKKQKPTINSQATGNVHQSVMNHPAYGILRVSNCHGGHLTLTGSDLVHNDYITLEVVPAQVHRSYGENIAMGSVGGIIKFAMSHAQFLSISSSIGQHSGTPVTLMAAPSTLNEDVVLIPQIEPLENSFDMSKAELKKMIELHVKEALDSLELVSQAVGAKKTGKAVADLVSRAINKISVLPTNLGSSVSFANEVLDNTAAEVQFNVEAKIQNHLKNVGIQSLSGSLNDNKELGFGSENSNGKTIEVK